jgi:hypothetical protein
LRGWEAISDSKAVTVTASPVRLAARMPSPLNAERSAVGTVGMGNLISLTPGFSPVTASVQMKNRFNGLFGADGKFQVVAKNGRPAQ